VKRVLHLLLPAAVTCILHLLTSLAWGWAALLAFVGWPLLGTIVTSDDDAPGGWSNLDGKQRPEWRTLVFWLQLLRNGAIAASVYAIDVVFRTHAPPALVLVAGGAVLASVLLERHFSRTAMPSAQSR
jgi:hypothetical protein